MYRWISSVRSVTPILQTIQTRSFAKVINTSQGKPKRELKGSTQAVFLVCHDVCHL